MVIKWLETNELEPSGEPPKQRAAEYVRMSTEHQKYSTDNQSAAIRKYAEQRGYEIVRTYADEGKSGLNIGGRLGLQKLLEDVESGQADFTALLVHDVSRWGRFQDPDEAASYELRCRRAGVQVHYCAEQFENDGSIGSPHRTPRLLPRAKSRATVASVGCITCQPGCLAALEP